MKVSTLLSAFILLVASDGIAFSQPDDSESPTFLNENPLDSMQLAKDKFDALHANLDELKQARWKAVRVQRDARMMEFLAGRGTLAFLLEAAVNALKSRLVVCTTQTERIAALEDHWSLMHAIEEVNRRRNDAGRIPTKDYRQSTYYRIDAEQRLRAARGQK